MLCRLYEALPNDLYMFRSRLLPTWMINELKQPRQRRQQEPRNAIAFNKNRIVVLLINRRKHIAFFDDLVAEVVLTSLLSMQKRPLAVLTLLGQLLIN